MLLGALGHALVLGSLISVGALAWAGCARTNSSCNSKTQFPMIWGVAKAGTGRTVGVWRPGF